MKESSALCRKSASTDVGEMAPLLKVDSATGCTYYFMGTLKKKYIAPRCGHCVVEVANEAVSGYEKCARGLADGVGQKIMEATDGLVGAAQGRRARRREGDAEA